MKPLGWHIGSDSREKKVGIDWFYQKKGSYKHLIMGLRNIGENNIINNLYGAYVDYIDRPFPSGDVEDIDFISFKCQWWLKTNMSIFSEISYDKSNKTGDNINSNLGIDLYYSIDENW